jgi:hypothetical protein
MLLLISKVEALKFQQTLPILCKKNFDIIKVFSIQENFLEINLKHRRNMYQSILLKIPQESITK